MFRLKPPLCAPHLCAEFLERIVRITRGFTVYQQHTDLIFLTYIYIYIKQIILNISDISQESIYWDPNASLQRAVYVAQFSSVKEALPVALIKPKTSKLKKKMIDGKISKLYLL